MSAGGSIPYHLRQHKAVERNLFIELLRKLNNYVNISDYVYTGFGGPFLEDFKQLHNALKINSMISLELDENTHKRQKFNKPISCVDLGEEPLKSGEFIARNDFNEPSLVWLDFAIPKDINEQMNDISQLVAKLKPKDIFKVTLNATPETLGKNPLEQDPKPFRLARIQELLTQEYCPVNLTVDDVTFKKYPKLLIRAAQRAISSGLLGRTDIKVHPLCSFIYRDGQQMLTFTAIVLENTDEALRDFLENSRIDFWSFYSNEWDNFKNISVPTMSLRERMFIEERLPNKNHLEINEDLGFFLGDDEAEAISNLENFIEYYKVIPWYSKVHL